MIHSRLEWFSKQKVYIVKFYPKKEAGTETTFRDGKISTRIIKSHYYLKKFQIRTKIGQLIKVLGTCTFRPDIDSTIDFFTRDQLLASMDDINRIIKREKFTHCKVEEVVVSVKQIKSKSIKTICEKI